MKAFSQFTMLPGAFGVIGRKQLSITPVNVAKNVIFTFMVTETRGPNTLTINITAIFQTEFRPQVKAVNGIV